MPLETGNLAAKAHPAFLVEDIRSTADGCGCALLVAGAVSVVLFIVFVVFAAIRSADPYRDGIARAQADPRVREALGAPIEAGWMVSGSIQTENRSGDCDISIPLNGSKQSGVLRVVGTKDGGRWTYTKMLVTPSAGPAIDLLNAGRASAAAHAKCRMGFSPSMGLRGIRLTRGPHERAG